MSHYIIINSNFFGFLAVTAIENMPRQQSLRDYEIIGLLEESDDDQAEVVSGSDEDVLEYDSVEEDEQSGI